MTWMADNSSSLSSATWIAEIAEIGDIAERAADDKRPASSDISFGSGIAPVWTETVAAPRTCLRLSHG